MNQVNIPVDLNKLGAIFADEINQYPEGRRRMHVRESLRRALQRYADFVGGGAEMRVSQEAFEQLALAYSNIIESHEAAKAERGALVGDGVVAQVVHDDDYEDLVHRRGGS
jgi:hypothetical protein